MDSAWAEASFEQPHGKSCNTPAQSCQQYQCRKVFSTSGKQGSQAAAESCICLEKGLLAVIQIRGHHDQYRYLINLNDHGQVHTVDAAVLALRVALVDAGAEEEACPTGWRTNSWQSQHRELLLPPCFALLATTQVSPKGSKNAGNSSCHPVLPYSQQHRCHQKGSNIGQPCARHP